jgi:hypothetical protein
MRCTTRLWGAAGHEWTNKPRTNTPAVDLPSSVTFQKTRMPPIKEEEEEDELEQSSSEEGEGDAYVDSEYTLSGILEPGNPARWACSALFGTINTAYFLSFVPQRRLTVCCLNRGP